MKLNIKTVGPCVPVPEHTLLYASLMTLRSYEGNVEDLALVFCIADSADPSPGVSTALMETVAAPRDLSGV